MRPDRERLSEIGSWALALCALLTTIFVVGREFVQGNTSPTAAEPQPIQVDGWQDALAAGIRSGSAHAPVQVVEFADFQCPFCARFEGIVRTIREEYPDEVAFTLAHYPLSQHRFAEPAGRAAECAHLQGRFEDMRSLLFERQQEFGFVPWTDFAKQAGIPDLEQFDACVNDSIPVERIEHDKQLAEKMGVRGTPTIVVNGWKLPVPPTSEQFRQIIYNVLEGRPPAADIDFFSSN